MADTIFVEEYVWSSSGHVYVLRLLLELTQSQARGGCSSKSMIKLQVYVFLSDGHLFPSSKLLLLNKLNK